MEILAKSPKNCSADELKLFEELVLMGDEVDPNGLKDRILNAEQLFLSKKINMLVLLHLNDRKNLINQMFFIKQVLLMKISMSTK
ncbi:MULTISPECIES: hypothetical protein [Salmonella]|uniref:hypothetical protein n=1 Tax=Salmonella TaxID=590 RepID=UPI001F147422|nr:MULTISPECIES: hypothetical protein [Salmonella]UMY43350.1 hypothetical protein MLB75_21925 [Salmonella enterica]